MDDTELESERIRRVYADYDSRPNERRKRDAHNPGNAAIASERLEVLTDLLHRRFGTSLASFRVLDVGCGAGSLLGWFREYGIPPHHLYGVDLLEDRIDAARREHPELTFSVGNANRLEFGDSSFQLVLCTTVFSSILDDLTAKGVAAEINRVLASNGVVGWYDLRYPNPFNPNTKSMTRRRIAELFPRYDMQLRSVTLLPPLARRLGPRTPVLYPALALARPLRSHYAGVLVRSSLRRPGG